METTVIITSFKDRRIFKTIDSLKKQTRPPDHVLIADGGSPSDFERDVRDYIRGDPRFSYNIMRGRCSDTRRKAIYALVLAPYQYHRTDIMVWIDADMTAFDDWLEELVRPIENDEADFTGGVWKRGEEKSKAEKILNQIMVKNQLLAMEDPAYIGMGNSAWSAEILKKLGGLDASSESDMADEGLGREGIVSGYYVSEDFDLNIRAIDAGFKGTFVPEAAVYHDQSHVNTFRKLTMYFYNNYVRAGMAYFKNKSTMGKFVKGSSIGDIAHPFELFLLLIKPIAFVSAWKEYNKIKGK